MAISVPISTEQYIQLKEISDKFNLSLKKTIEHLVSLYFNEMIKDSVEEMKEDGKNNSPKIHDIEITAPSLVYQQSPATVQVQQHRNLFASPPIRNESPQANYANTLVKNHQTIPKPEVFTVPLYNPNSQGCPSCGTSTNSDAKFCHNCGHSL